MIDFGMKEFTVGAGDTEWASAVGDFAQSELFVRTFADGMAMVEETAAYLDGEGRQESRRLTRKAALAYAGESMRLTTRLMQVASWLLVQKAIREGEMSPAEAREEKYRLGAQEICRGTAPDAMEELPPRLLDLLTRSERLYDRVDRLDARMYREKAKAAPAGGSPVQDQQSRIQAAFEGLAAAARAQR